MKAYVRIPLQPYRTSELAKYYKRSTRQFQRELKMQKNKYGIKKRHWWEIPQVQMIFDDFGWPEIEIDVQQAA